MIVYVVQHARPPLDPDGEDDVELIGVYSSEAAAQAAIARLRTQPGFVDWPDEFHVDPYRVDEDHWTEGFVSAP